MAAEHERMKKMLTEMLAALERDSAARSQEDASSQAAFAGVLDERILGEEQADADNLVKQQRERQLPMERQAFDAGRADGSSRDELANYAMIRRGQGNRPTEAQLDAMERSADTAGFERDFARDQATRGRLTDMFGGKSKVPEGERQRILSELSRAAAANTVDTSGPPATEASRARGPSASLDIPPPNYPSVSYPSPGAPNRGDLDEAALRERAVR